MKKLQKLTIISSVLPLIGGLMTSVITTTVHGGTRRSSIWYELSKNIVLLHHICWISIFGKWRFDFLMQNLSHPLFAKAIQGLCLIFELDTIDYFLLQIVLILLLFWKAAFHNLRIRIGGSLQDQVLYDVGSLKVPCHPFQKISSGLFGFSKGCLHMNRWDELNHLFTRTG